MPAEHARFLPLRAGLHTCIAGAVVRDTRGLALTGRERCNYFPAAPTVTLTWSFEGRGELFEPVLRRGTPPQRQPLPRLLFSGVQTRPFASWNPGPVHALMVALQPEAARLLLGIDAASWRDEHVPAAAVLRAQDLALCQSLFAPGTDAERFARLQDGWAARWQALRPPQATVARYVEDWMHSLIQRAAISSAGRSARQMERRIKSWSGLSLRELRRLARIQRAFYLAFPSPLPSNTNLAAVAAEAGFADQSHMGRHIKQSTGFSPAAFRRHMHESESFWLYRLFGELPPVSL
jgi:AraC-like DNA-binding protein